MKPIDILRSVEMALPRGWDGGDFHSQLAELFQDYFGLLEKLDGDDAICPDIASGLEEIRSTAQYVLEAISDTYGGHPHKAFEKITKAIAAIPPDSIESMTKKLYHDENLDYLYRVRSSNAQFFEKKDLFHIPFEKRSFVGPQRYSLPGLPCLYLGGSIFVCWEEMGRPDVNTIHASRYKHIKQEECRVLQFGYRPSFLSRLIDEREYYKQDMTDEFAKYLISYFQWWPILAACSIRVHSRLHPFKSEYIIPHLVLQWVTSNQSISTIRYFSVHVEKYYDKPMACSNFVFPTRSIIPKGHCPVLAADFHLSEPLAWQLASMIQVSERVKDHNCWEIEYLSGVRSSYVCTDQGGFQLKLDSPATGSL